MSGLVHHFIDRFVELKRPQQQLVVAGEPAGIAGRGQVAHEDLVAGGGRADRRGGAGDAGQRLEGCVDLTELDPSLDVSDISALTAGRWVCEILAGFTMRQP